MTTLIIIAAVLALAVAYQARLRWHMRRKGYSARMANRLTAIEGATILTFSLMVYFTVSGWF